MEFLAIFREKLAIFWQFFLEKRGNCLAIFRHLNVNFPEGHLVTYKKNKHVTIDQRESDQKFHTEIDRFQLIFYCYVLLFFAILCLLKFDFIPLFASFIFQNISNPKDP